MIKIGVKKKNKFPSTLMAYPGYGYQGDSPSTAWRLYVSGLAYRTPEEFNMRKRVVIKVLKKVMDLSPESFETETFRNRVAPFMVDGVPRQKIHVRIGQEVFPLKKKTRRSGQFRNWIQVSSAVVNSAIQTDKAGRKFLPYSVISDHKKTEDVQSIIHLVNRSGVSVISDIDDTIKYSMVSDRKQLLANTFLNEFRGIEGMAELYTGWAEAGIDFQYVSSSPWQLFDSLFEMQSEGGFPAGTMHLRNFRIRDQVVKKMMLIRRKGKVATIKKLIKNLPHRQFVLIGDSGEKDPEIYQKILGYFPDQVKAIFIRDLAECPLEHDRRLKLQNCLPLRRSSTFSTAEELGELVTPQLGLEASLTS